MVRAQRFGIATALAAGLFWLASPAGATTFHFVASLDGAQEVPANITPGVGAANVFFDDVSKVMTWNIAWNSLIGSVTDMHFHAAAIGVAGPIRVFITDQTSPSTGSAVLNAAREAELMAELFYINIHTTFDGSGEIRGQVLLPEPALGLLLGTGVVALALRGRRHLHA